MEAGAKCVAPLSPWLAPPPSGNKLGPLPKASVAVWLVTVFDILGFSLEGSAFPLVDVLGLLGTVSFGTSRVGNGSSSQTVIQDPGSWDV